MKEAWKGIKPAEWVIAMASEAKKKQVMCINSGVVFESVAEAARSTKVARTYFSYRLSKGMLIRGAKYEYYDEDIPVFTKRQLIKQTA